MILKKNVFSLDPTLESQNYCNFAVNARKSLKEFGLFFDLKLILFLLFLILLVVAEAGIVFNFFLNFEQKEPLVLIKLVLSKKSVFVYSAT